MDLLPQPVQYLLDPWILMASSVYYLPPTIYRLVKSRQWTTLFRWSSLQPVWFGTFWRWAGPEMSINTKRLVLPLLQGRTRKGRILKPAEEKAAPPISGTVVEIGSGIGIWIPVFGQIVDAMRVQDDDESAHQRRSSDRASTSGVVTKIYGVEPNTSVHEDLQSRVVAAGLKDIYEIMPMGIEDLATSGKVSKGSIDCVVCILCLCGIPDPQENIRALYEYLRPGGRLYAYEHVCCSRHWAIRLYQRLINVVWPTLIGGCELQRDTGRYLREAGPWSSVDLAQPIEEPWYHVVPHILGVLTK